MQTQVAATRKSKLTQADLVVGAKVQPCNEPNKTYILIKEIGGTAQGMWSFSNCDGRKYVGTTKMLLTTWQLV